MALIITLGVLGLVLGFFMPVAAQKVCVYKFFKKGKEFLPLAWHLVWWIRLLSAFVSACGFVFCAVFVPGIFLRFLFCLIWIVIMLVIFVDIYIRIIPNEAVLLLLALGSVYQITIYGFYGLGNALITMLVVAAVFLIIAKILGFAQIGAGDVKLASVMALTLGYPRVLDAFLIMALSMGAFCFGGIALNKLTKYSLFPYAPFIGFGLLGGMGFMFF
ncbi:MAG: prepilin peptidase [Lachnospiraceae bacterium]|nr:prepilin peptidase [Lachnospiraceae bacterium]